MTPAMTQAPTPAEPAEPIRLNRRQHAKAVTRQKVLDAAENLFGTVGYKAATIRGIAKDAGMSTGAVFANFEDKDALYLAIHGHPALTPEQGLHLAAALRRAVEFLEASRRTPFRSAYPTCWPTAVKSCRRPRPR
ncbi:TetR/AcrR family transcriptional regulator [Brevundimonas pondensis]|nr:helix-turn-helix domain-containing protein [Brevundimonas pondensis]